MLALRAALQAWLAEHRHEHSDAAGRGKRLHYAWDAGTNILLVDYSALLGIDCLHAVRD
ncbi:hypothetical protein [Halochromatium salexigens]|uniref:hypothetical protein n=1 Tax=Halochromatium salexigens TaxID=49447 RepID=UPI00191172E5|nr:hypothetical protein [Halochromatium salexigens]